MRRRTLVRTYRLAGRIGIAALLLCCPLSCLHMGRRQAETVPGPETPDLRSQLHGHLILAEPLGAISAISLRSGKKTVVRGRRSRGDPEHRQAHSVSGPDERGQIAFIDDMFPNEWHELRVVHRTGTEFRTLFRRPEHASWKAAISDDLALSPRGGRIALVSKLNRIQMQDPPAYVGEGTLEIWNVESGQGKKPGVIALESTMSWFPDGRKLAYVALMPPSDDFPASAPEDGFGRQFERWKRRPVTCVLDLNTGKSYPLHLGWNPVVSSDGKTVIVTDYDVRWRLVNVASGNSKSISAPGAWGPPLALLESKLVLYPALPTAGSPIRWTKNNSPLVGKKLMLTIKVADLDTGEFQTVFGSYDARMAVSAGP